MREDSYMKAESIANKFEEKTKTWLQVDLPNMEYREVWDLQAYLVDARKKGIIQNDLILLLEHPAVFTLGRRGGSEHMKMSEDFLEQKGIPVIRVERGGSITFHGPGQLVVYIIIDLGRSRLGVAEYVNRLEETMKRVSGDWGIHAERNPLNRGVWVGENKLGSIGIAVRRGVSFHGFALNVNTSLEPFTWVNPCGLEDARITSMKEVLGKELPMKEIRNSVCFYIQEVFGVQLEKIDPASILQSGAA
jgi:lipoate-protein ligase B